MYMDACLGARSLSVHINGGCANEWTFAVNVGLRHVCVLCFDTGHTTEPWVKVPFSAMSDTSINGGIQGALQAWRYWSDYMKCNSSATAITKSTTYQEAVNMLPMDERIRFEIVRSLHRDIPYMVRDES